jgi:cytochrome P450
VTKVELGFEPFDPTWRSSPLQVFEELRDRAPVYRAHSGTWVLSRYESVREALADPELFSSAPVDEEALGIPRHVDETSDPELVELLGATFHGVSVDPEELATVRTVIGSDGAEHGRQRRLISRAFSPRRVEELRARMEAITADCLAGIDTADEFELMEGLANVLPRQIIGELLSVEPDRRPDLTRWAQEMMGATTGAARNTDAARRRLLDVLGEFTGFFVPRIDAKRAHPGDDFISDLVRAEESDALTSLETLLLIRLLMLAGTDTTAALIGNTTLALLRRPEILARLTADPALIPAAIEESLRYWAPFYFCLREVTRPTTIEGVLLPEGAMVALMLGAANLDPRAFPDPTTFDIDRSERHVAFGHGVHFCVGAHLARLEALVAMTALLPLLQRFRLADEPLELAEEQLLQGFRRIPLVAA